MMNKNIYNFGPGGHTEEDEDGLYWDNPDNPYNGSDDEEGGDFYQSYEEGYYSDDDPNDDQED